METFKILKRQRCHLKFVPLSYILLLLAIWVLCNEVHGSRIASCDTLEKATNGYLIRRWEWPDFLCYSLSWLQHCILESLEEIIRGFCVMVWIFHKVNLLWVWTRKVNRNVDRQLKKVLKRQPKQPKQSQPNRVERFAMTDGFHQLTAFFWGNLLVCGRRKTKTEEYWTPCFSFTRN